MRGPNDGACGETTMYPRHHAPGAEPNAAPAEPTASSSSSSRRRTSSRRGRRSDAVVTSGLAKSNDGEKLGASMTSARSSSSWPFVKDGSKEGKDDAVTESGKTSTSLSSLSSVFDDEETWDEFKRELDARGIKTQAGIQGLLSKFIAEKRQGQRREAEAEEERQKKKMEDDLKRGGELAKKGIRLPAGERRNNLRRKSYGSSLILEKMAAGMGLAGNIEGGDDKSTAAEEMWTVDNSKKQCYNDVIRGDAESITAGSMFHRDNGGEYEEFDESKLDEMGNNNILGMLLRTTSSGRNSRPKDGGAGLRGGLGSENNGRDGHNLDCRDGNTPSRRRERSSMGILSRSDNALEADQRRRRSDIEESKNDRLCRSYTSSSSDDNRSSETDSNVKDEPSSSQNKAQQPSKPPFWLFGLGGSGRNKEANEPPPQAKDTQSKAASSAPSQDPEPLGVLDEGPSFGPPRRGRGRRGRNGDLNDSNHSSLSSSRSRDLQTNPQDVHNASASSSMSSTPPSQRSCLKPSTREASSNDPSSLLQTASAPIENNSSATEGDDGGQATIGLLRLLLSLDNGPSEERAGMSRSRPSSTNSSQGEMARGEEKKDDRPLRRSSDRQQRPSSTAHSQPKSQPEALKPSRSSDSLTPSNEGSSCGSSRDSVNSVFKYKPRRKHAKDAQPAQAPASGGPNRSPPARAQSFAAKGRSDSIQTTTTVDTRGLMSTGSTQDVRRRHVPKLSDGRESANQTWSLPSPASNAPASSSAKGSANDLKRHMQGMMSTGSIRDIKKRHIPVNNHQNGNQDWSNVPQGGSSNPLLNASQGGGSNPLLNGLLNAGNASSGTNKPLLQQRPHLSMNSMISTGSSKDMRRRRVPTVNSERYNQEWMASQGNASSGNMGGIQSMSSSNMRGNGQSTDTLSRQVAAMASTGSIRDLRKRQVMTTDERANQDWNAQQSLDWGAPGTTTTTVMLSSTAMGGSGNIGNTLLQGHSGGSNGNLLGNAGARPSGDDLNRQVASMVSTGSLRDLKKRNVLTAQERANQDWNFDRKNSIQSSDSDHFNDTAVDGGIVGAPAIPGRRPCNDVGCAANGPSGPNRKMSMQDASVISGLSADLTANFAGCSVDLRKHQLETSSSGIGNKVSPSGIVPGSLREQAVARTALRRTQSDRPRAQEVSRQDPAQPKQGMSAAPCSDLFRRYLQGKPISSRLLSSLNDETDNAVALSSKESHESSNDALPSRGSSGGELLVDWGDPGGSTTDDEEDQATPPQPEAEKQMILDDDMARARLARMGSYRPKKKERRGGIAKPQQSQQPRDPFLFMTDKLQQSQDDPLGGSVEWAGSGSNVEEKRYITVDHNEAALRRVSDLTTAFDSDDEDLDDGEEVPAQAFRRRVRKMSIREGTEEEEDGRNSFSGQVPGEVNAEADPVATRMRSLSIQEGTEEEELEDRRNSSSRKVPGVVNAEADPVAMMNANERAGPKESIMEEGAKEVVKETADEPIQEHEGQKVEAEGGGFFFIMGGPGDADEEDCVDIELDLEPDKDYVTKTFTIPDDDEDEGKAKRGMSFKMGEGLIRNMSRETLHEDEETEEEECNEVQVVAC